MFTYRQYIDDVLHGRVVTGELARLAVERHVNDLSHLKGYTFDEAEGQRWIRFAHLCRHWKGIWAGEPIVLSPWQQFMMAVQFGWRREDGTRRFRSAYTEVARKNGKTTILAVKSLAHCRLDKESGAQVYFAATKEDQARIGFRDAQEIVKKTPGLPEYFKIYTKSVVCDSSFIKPLGSDSNTQDGYDPSYGIIDEYHAHPTSEMLNVLESGMGARRQPMIDVITTAGFNKEGPCYTELRKTSIDILRGIKEDDTHLALIYSLDKDDDWENPELWIKSNPNMGVSVRAEFLMDRYTKAKNEGGSKEVDFKTKNLNLWTDSAETWIPDDRWMSCNFGEPPDLTGCECFVGMDLSVSRDLTAVVLFFPDIDGKHQIMPFFFVPELKVKERLKKDGVNYGTWIDAGYIIETPGNATDYDFIEAKIQELAAKYRIGKLLYDRYNSTQLVIHLQNLGITCEGAGQGFVSMSSPAKQLERLVYLSKINHAGNPVLRWMNSNVAIKTDPAGNIKIDKDKSQDKVDGIVALAMAIWGWMSQNTPTEWNGEVRTV